MRPKQKVIIYSGGIRKKTGYEKYFEASQARFAERDDHRACDHCGRYVKIAKSGKLFNHRMGVGINNIMCLNPAT